MQKIVGRIPFAYPIIYKTIALFSKLSFFQKPAYDLVFIVVNRAWALERVCIEIGNVFYGTKKFHYELKRIPKSKNYFFSHYKKFLISAIYNPHIFRGKIFIYYTHYSGSLMSDKDLAKVLNMVCKIFVMNSKDKKFLKDIGVHEDKLIVAFAGADEKIFFPEARLDSTIKTVGFCLRYENFDGYAPRKNYDFLIELVFKLKAYRIILIGKNWENSPYLKKLETLEKFTYVDVEYEKYPIFYNKMDIFCSVSKLEGGPLSLIEAMFCDAIPVVSAAGLAPDLIINGKNGYVFSTEATTDEVVTLVENALQNIQPNVVKNSVKHLTWSNFGKRIVDEIKH